MIFGDLLLGSTVAAGTDRHRAWPLTSLVSNQ